MIVDFSDRGNHRCRTAETALLECSVLNLLPVYRALIHLHSKVVLCHIDKASSCDGRKDGIRLRNHQMIVLIHEEDVGSAGLLNLRSCCCIQVNVLRKAFLMCRNNCMQAHCIVQSRLDVAGSVRCSAVIITDLYIDRLRAALEVRANRSRKYAVLVIICRLYTDNRADAEHIRTNIKCCTGSERRNPCCICLNHLMDGINKLIYRKRRHLQTLCRIIHSLCVQIRAEAYDMSVLGCICLQSLKHRLAVLENTGILTHDNLVIVNEGALIPFAGFCRIICHIPFIGLQVTEAEV